MNDKQVRILLLLGMALAAMIVLAASLSRLEFLPGEPFPLRSLLEGFLNREAAPGTPLPLGGLIRTLMLLFVWVLLPILIVSLLVSRDLRRRFLRWMLVGSLWMLFLYFVIQAIRRRSGQETEGESELGGAEQLPEAVPFPAPPEFIVNPPQWFVALVSLLLAALIVGAVWFVLWRLRRRRVPAELLAEEAQEALQELHAGGDLKDVVVRCYLEMTRVLSQQRGLQRHKDMTPREFETYLRGAGFRDDHIQQLTRLFERVRYGARRPGPREEQEAVDCLRAIVQAYGRAT